MDISKTIWIILIISVFVAIFVMLLVATITILKINKIKKNIILKQQKLGNLSKVASRKNAGQLLWDLKATTTNPLEDIQLEFLINTAVRNDYKTFKIINAKSNYESTSLKKIAKLKIKDNNPDLTIIFVEKKTFEEKLKSLYQKLKNRQMIAVVNTKNKKIKYFLEKLKAKYDIISIGKGIILITK